MVSEDHSRKVKEGLQRARDEGKTLGRPMEKGIDADALMPFADKGYSIRKCAEIFHVSRMTIVRRLQSVGREQEYIERYKSSMKDDNTS